MTHTGRMNTKCLLWAVFSIRSTPFNTQYMEHMTINNFCACLNYCKATLIPHSLIHHSAYLVEHCSFPDHMSSSFLPDVLDPAADEVASWLRQNFGGWTQTALMFPYGRHETTQSTLSALTLC